MLNQVSHIKISIGTYLLLSRNQFFTRDCEDMTKIWHIFLSRFIYCCPIDIFTYLICLALKIDPLKASYKCINIH